MKSFEKIHKKALEHFEEKERLSRYQIQGHTYHCACRLVWGDGECECELRNKKPPIISQMVLEATNYCCGEVLKLTAGKNLKWCFQCQRWECPIHQHGDRTINEY